MRIAIASGKGGTGKSSISTSLAAHLAENGTPVALFDCDVEEPNCHLLLNRIQKSGTPIPVKIPALTNPEECTECGKCAEVCRFNALASFKTKPLFFPELCHSCGGCILACPHKAISMIDHNPAVRRSSREKGLRLIQGVMNIGEAQATRVIRELLKTPVSEEIQIIDSPPGTSCSFMATVSISDYIILVTEPTPFGLHDLKLALEAIESMKIPYGIIENKAEQDVTLIQDFCREKGHPLLMSIPFSRGIAENYSHGRLPFYNQEAIQQRFGQLVNQIRSECT